MAKIASRMRSHGIGQRYLTGRVGDWAWVANPTAAAAPGQRDVFTQVQPTLTRCRHRRKLGDPKENQRPNKGSKGERGAEDPLPQWEKRGKQGHRTVRAQRPLNWLDWGSPNRAPSASTICPRSSPRPLSAQHCSVGCDLKSFHPLLQAARAVPSCCASSHPSRPAL